MSMEPWMRREMSDTSEAVRALGDKIGFGRLIDIAHKEWDSWLSGEHGISSHSRAFKLAEASLILEHYAKSKATAEEVKTRFMAELNELLERWDAVLDAKDHYVGYPECGEDVRMTVTIPAIYDETTFEEIRPMTEIDLGRWVDSTT